MTTRTILKILTADDWSNAKSGAPVEAPVDRADGYVHFSTVSQVQATLDKWFQGATDTVLIAFDANDFKSTLKWEPARGNELFPHVYGRVDASQAKQVWLLANGVNGAPVAPKEALEWSPE